MKRKALLLATLLAAAPAFADEAHAPSGDEFAEELQGYVPGASALEGRIRAPCCWNQTLDIHGSEVSNGLRREIRKRLRAGESAEAIEKSLVDRYGERILAVPPGSALKSLAVLLSVSMAGVGVAGFFMLRRWRDRNAASASRAPEAQKVDARTSSNHADYDRRLDAELRDLDE